MVDEGKYVIQLAPELPTSLKVNTPWAPPCAVLIVYKVVEGTHNLTDAPVTADNPNELALAVIVGVAALYKFEKKQKLGGILA